jgi:hypothetical protein
LPSAAIVPIAGPPVMRVTSDVTKAAPACRLVMSRPWQPAVLDRGTSPSRLTKYGAVPVVP